MKTFTRYLNLLLITGIIVSIYAISQVPSGARVSAPFEGEGGEANTLGGYLVVIMSIIAGIMTGSQKPKRVIQLGIAILIMLIPFAYTLSRSSWISLFPAIMALMIFSPKRKNVFIAVIIGTIFISIFMPSVVFERIAYTFSPEHQLRQDVVHVGDTSLDPSTSERIQSWGFTIKQWAEKPVFGWGVTGAGFKDAQYFRVLAETGAVGFALFIVLLYNIQKTAIGVMKDIDPIKNSMYHGLVIGYIAGFWGILIHAIGANTFIIVRVMEPFWFLTAMVVALPDLLKQENELTAGNNEQTKIKTLVGGQTNETIIKKKTV